MKVVKIVFSVLLFIMLNTIIVKAEENPYSPPYSATINQEDVELLACVIHGESGADFCSDTMRYYVGSVVVNRLNHDQFPNTMQEVVYQPGQYGCIHGKYFKADARCMNIATDILINGSRLPADVVYQSNARLGHGVYIKEQNMYFCFI